MCASVAFGIQHTNRMRRFMLSPVACLSPTSISTLTQNLHVFRKRKKFTEYKIYFRIPPHYLRHISLQEVFSYAVP